jgi:predicted RNA binding protein YcfA (HicA-like mRNA interferase family)
MPSWKDYERFLKNDGWKALPRNSGVDRAYVKQLSNGAVLRTRVSKSSKEIGKGLFASMLKNQAVVSKEYFNRVLSNKRNSSDDPDGRR